MIEKKNKGGRVILAGAGPGDIGLITVKAMDFLKKCDVILYDKLANPELLKECKEDCEKIFVGKEAGLHHVSQDGTISMLIEKAQEGKLVLRLKGGDPLVFGRGSEEAMALKKENIDYEIIPGITAGMGVSAYAGIPLTHRSLVTQTVFVTAHESPDKENSQVEWEHLAKMKNTVLVIYMGVGMLPKIAEVLIGFGMDRNTTLAIIENGTLSQQRTIISSLFTVKDDIVKHSIKPPAITLIGPTIDLREKLKWFEAKPLFGKRIVSTRADDQASSFYNMLKQEGATVLPFKTIKTKLAGNIPNLREYFNDNKFDWMVFSSENGVRYFFRALEMQGYDTRLIGDIKIAVIGSGTAKRLNKYFLIPDFIPSRFTSDFFVEEFPANYDLQQKKILRVKGNFKKDIIKDGLDSIGAYVKSLVVYNLFTDKPDGIIIADLKINGADACTFTSSSTVENFFDILGDENARRILSNSKVFAIGPVTEATLRKYNIGDINVAKTHTLEGLLEILKNNL